MRIFKKIAFLVILFGILILNSTCTKQKWFGTVTWEGHVYDKNGNPAQGVHMSLKGCSYSGDALTTCKGSYGDFEIGSADTDGSGHFKIDGKPARNGAYYAHVSNMGAIKGGDSSEGDLKTTSFTKIYLP